MAAPDMFGRLLRWPLLRYGLVGVTTNSIGYGGYLLLANGCGLDSKLAMSLVFIGATLLAFRWNRRFTFAHRGNMGVALRRHLATYGFGYLLNLAGLAIMVDYLHWSHEWVQLGLIIVVAGLLFLLQRFWVFPAPTVALPQDKRAR